MNMPRQATLPTSLPPHPWRHARLTSSQAAQPRHVTSPAPSHYSCQPARPPSHKHYPRRRQNRSSAAETASTSAKSSTKELVDDLLQRIGNSGQEQGEFVFCM